jgi:hypothetical protein
VCADGHDDRVGELRVRVLGGLAVEGVEPAALGSRKQRRDSLTRHEDGCARPSSTGRTTPPTDWSPTAQPS